MEAIYTERLTAILTLQRRLTETTLRCGDYLRELQNPGSPSSEPRAEMERSADRLLGALLDAGVIESDLLSEYLVRIGEADEAIGAEPDREMIARWREEVEP